MIFKINEIRKGTALVKVLARSSYKNGIIIRLVSFGTKSFEILEMFFISRECLEDYLSIPRHGSENDVIPHGMSRSRGSGA